MKDRRWGAKGAVIRAPRIEGYLMPDDLYGADAIIIEIKHTTNVMHLNYLETISPGLWKSCLPWDRSLVPKTLGTAALEPCSLFGFSSNSTGKNRNLILLLERPSWLWHGEWSWGWRQSGSRDRLVIIVVYWKAGKDEFGWACCLGMNGP